MKQYDEIMDKIEVTEEMKIRILKNIQNSDVVSKSADHIIPLRAVKKYLSVAACFVVLLVGVFAIPKFLPQNNDDPNVLTSCSDIVTVLSAEELADTVGFDVEELDNLPFKVKETIYTSYWGELGEVSYIGENQSVTLRKSVGDEDNSGDYTDYDNHINIDVNGIKIELRGEGHLFYLAVWNRNGFSYSVSVENGISETDFVNMAGSIICRSCGYCGGHACDAGFLAFDES